MEQGVQQGSLYALDVLPHLHKHGGTRLESMGMKK
jgi:hypothetical protein